MLTSEKTFELLFQPEVRIELALDGVIELHEEVDVAPLRVEGVCPSRAEERQATNAESTAQHCNREPA